MKKLIITSLSALAFAIAFTGCGESGSVSSASSDTSSGNGAVVSPTVDVVSAAEVTKPQTPFNLSEKLGTPPGLPE